MKYQNETLKKIIFPLGGIGSGSIGLCGFGGFQDFEIFNRPDKGSLNGYTHFAVRAKKQNGEVIPRVLQGDTTEDLMGQYQGKMWVGYGYGPEPGRLGAYRHFKNCEFLGEFPIAELSFSDESFPADVKMKAFNPFIPLDSDNSSIPAAFFEITFTNKTEEAIDFDCAFSFGNPYPSSVNEKGEKDGVKYIKLSRNDVEKDSTDYGDLTISCEAENVAAQECWYRGGWRDSIVSFWNEFTSGKELIDRHYNEAGNMDMASIMGSVSLKPNESGSMRFIVSWNVPNNYAYWAPLKDENGKDITWKNYYAKLFEDSTASAIYALKNWDMLYQKTDKFRRELFSQTLPSEVIDAAASNLSVLKTATVLRLENGEFYGWEGMHEKIGSCEGTCQHVWNYAYALCFLFPDLERSIRDLEFKYAIAPSGESNFRLKLPLGRTDHEYFRACVDGQMGTIIKTYREWKISGDNDWMKGHFHNVCRLLDYAMSEENHDAWDRDADGILEGRQHHTLDMELFGPSAWLEGFYLAALFCVAEMAEFLGEDNIAQKYRALYEKGKKYLNSELFSGEYFIQKIDLSDKSITERFGCSDLYWNDETKEIKYQIAGGCDIDQLCAQWHANILSLDRIFDKDKTDIALSNLYKNNFKENLREFDNPWRVFALNDEASAIICTYPEGSLKPQIPIPYCEESMTGFEYQLATLLMSEGKIEEGLKIVKAIRNRFKGDNRNPFNEFECGSNYARSMASFAAVPLLSGFYFDMPKKAIGFEPKLEGDFKALWSLEGAWGNVIRKSDSLQFNLLDGELGLRFIKISGQETVKAVYIDGKETEFKRTGEFIEIPEALIKKSVELRL